ncbi:MAG: hypothetical protein MJ252_23360, partial [archaeon]|nr:hypothetical protein [archaeon]
MNRPHVPLSVYFKPNQYYNDFIQNSNKNYVSYVNETNEIERCLTPAHNLNIDFLTSKIGQENLFRNKIPYQFFEKNNGFQSTKNKYPYYYQRDFNDYERVINKIYSYQTPFSNSLSKSMDFTKINEDSKYDKYLNENNFDKEDYKNIPKENPIEIPKEEIKIPENKDIYEDYKK